MKMPRMVLFNMITLMITGNRKTIIMMIIKHYVLLITVNIIHIICCVFMSHLAFLVTSIQ